MMIMVEDVDGEGESYDKLNSGGGEEKERSRT